MRSMVVLLALCVMVQVAAAANCVWSVTENISDPAEDSASDSGMTLEPIVTAWAWRFDYHAGQFTISGDMQTWNIMSSTSLSKAASGNGTYTVARIQACSNPQEDIEAYARNEFTATVHLDDDNNTSAIGSLKIRGSKCSLDCNAKGGVTLSNTALEQGQESGTISLELWGVTLSVQWALSGGDDLQQNFNDENGGTGGNTPEVFTCHTDLQLDVNTSDANGIPEEAEAHLSDSKYEVKVWGTCDGYCGVQTLVLQRTDGY